MAAQARITRFLGQTGCAALEALQARATADPGWFWEQVAQDLELDWYRPSARTLDLSRGAPWPQWWQGGLMNLAHECVDKHVATERREKAAVVYEGEDGQSRTWTYADLYAESNRLAHGLTELGITKGDRVGLFLPMMPETIAAILALAKVGAIFIPLFSGFAPQAVASRLADVGAKLLITADGFTRRGAHVAMKAVADEAAALAPCVERVLVIKRTNAQVPQTEQDIWYHELIADKDTTYPTLHLAPSDPFMIIHTSGTTGRPKGALHVHGGFPIKAAQDIAHCFDLHQDETIFWFTDVGWMMGPWVIFGSLLLGATCFLYDGAPDHPGPDRIWSMVAHHRITHLGVSPTIIRALMKHGEEYPRRHDLSSLRIIGGAGEPWNPEPYRWFFEQVGGGRCPLINYSGGTETSGGILGCVVTRPIKVCSFNTAIPGMAATVLDEQGRPAEPGTVGELSITAPWVGMTNSFWQDDDRYIEAYWSRFPGVWVHGDWASVDADGFWYIHGRSDDTIKIAGKRVGPAEFESVLVSHPAVAEAAAISIPHELKGEGVVCFVILREGMAATADELKELIISQMGKPLAPEAVRFVGALPKTRSAKIMRRVIKAVWLGKEPGDLSALENPDAVAEIAAVRT